MEKIVKPVSGFLALLLALVSLAAGVYLFTTIREGEAPSPWFIIGGILLVVASFFILKGLMIIQPNHSRILNFFGKYSGSVKDNGLFFVNPLYVTKKLSLRAHNLQGQTLKVNDKMGNPIEIGAVIVWQVGDTYKAAYEVDDYEEYVKVQSEAAVRHLANSFQ